MAGEKITNSPKKRRGPTGIPIEAIVEYAEQGLTTRDIAKLIGCDHSNVVHRLKAVGFTRESNTFWSKHKVKVMQTLQSKILNSISPIHLKKANLQSLLTSFGILYDKERLETGQSTANVSSWSHIITSAEAQAEKSGVNIAPSAPPLTSTAPIQAETMLPADADDDDMANYDTQSPLK